MVVSLLMRMGREGFCQMFQSQFAAPASGAADPSLDRLSHADADNGERYQKRFQGSWVDGVAEQRFHRGMLVEPLASYSESGFILFEECGACSFGGEVPRQASHLLRSIGNLGHSSVVHSSFFSFSTRLHTGGISPVGD